MSFRWYLTYDNGRGHAGEVELTKTDVAIGNVESADLRLEHDEVSQRHARIVVKDGKFIIVDLRSDTGTWINGRRITSPQVLRESDAIAVGPYQLGVEDGSLPELRDDRPLTDDEVELLGLIAEAPGDDGPRMVYADHLMDRGDPAGEFIALQCELARTPEPQASGVERRLRELLDRHPDTPMARLVGSGIAFARGFLSEALCTTPGRRRRRGAGLHRLSPAIYELGEQLERYVATSLHRARRVPPDGSGEDVVVLRWGSRFERTSDVAFSRLGDQLAANQARLRELADGAVTEALELVRLDKSRQIGLAMRWPFGEPLAARLATAHAPAVAVSIAAELCRHLGALETHGVHVTALNPAHVVVGPAGAISIADVSWAIAPDAPLPYPDVTARRVLTSTAVPTSPLFRTMAPETFGARPIDARAAVFVVCVLLHQLLAGEHPFPLHFQAGRTPLAAIELGSQSPLEPIAGAPASLSAVVARGLRLRPADRYEGVAALGEALDGIAAEAGWGLGQATIANALATAR